MTLYAKVKQWLSGFYHPVPYGYKRLEDGSLVPIDTPEPEPGPEPIEEPPVVDPIVEPPVAGGNFLHPVPYGYKRLPDGSIVLIGTPEPDPTPEPEPPEPIPEPPISEPKMLKDYIQIMDIHDISNHLVSVKSSLKTPHYFAGIPQYNSMYLQYYRIYKLCMELTHKNFPGGDQFVMGDAGGMSSEHPQHNSYYGIVDFNYLTHEHNNTHYWRREFPMEKIWEEDSYPYNNLLKDKVDLEKMFYFFSLLKKCCPKATFSVNKALNEEFQQMGDITASGADMPQWNHHIHTHCDLGSEIDYEAIL